MKYVVLSFDDGRKDFYTNAFPILQKYHMPATLNVITEFFGKTGVPGFTEADGNFISEKELEILKADKECSIEIASHSADHTNCIDSIEKSIRDLAKLCRGGGIGFASPFSQIYSSNFSKYKELIPDCCYYIRSGNQIRRDGLVYAGIYILYRFTKSKILFRIYNRRNIICNEKFNPLEEFFPCVTCNADNTMAQLISFIENLPNNSSIVICFHSITDNNCAGKFYNKISDIDSLCKFLRDKKDVCVVTNKELVDIILRTPKERNNI